VSGIFEGAQPIYAEHGIATFPVGPDKKPAITHYQRVGLPGSHQLVTKHAHAGGLGFMSNASNRIAVLDYDSTDERGFADALDRYGDTPIKVRTASGKWHAYYRHNGERRRVRALGDSPIDILGDGGFAVAPPSVIPGKGTYQFVDGGLDDLSALPAMKNLPPWCYPKGKLIALDGFQSPLRGRREHDGRNEALYKAIGPPAREIHRRGGTREQLFALAMKHNAECEPMEVAEVNKVVGSVWNMTVEGRNFIGRPGAFIDTPDYERLLTVNQDALVLLLFLRLHQGIDATFWCTNSLAETFGWRRQRLAEARRALIEMEYLKPIRHAEKGRAAEFRWNPAMF
jgi:hypothetical protein